MKKSLFILLLLASFQLNAQLNVNHLLCENLSNPHGIGVSKPQLSWQMTSKDRGVMQTAYEIEVSTDPADFSSSKAVWKSGKIESDQSVHLTYQGAPLKSAERYFWKVRVWDNKNKQSAWSPVAMWQMGLLNASEWSAKWIEASSIQDSTFSPVFRKEFKITKKLKSATLFVTSHGLYTGMLNGSRIGDAYFTPGWTSYNKRLQYQTYDVTNQVNQGDNAIGFTLGNGWYRGQLTWSMYKNIWGKKLGLLAELRLVFSDGTEQVVSSDNSWKYSTGDIRYSEIYHGEWIDHRFERNGWSVASYNDQDWKFATEASYSNANLVASNSEPARRKEAIAPVKIFRTPKNELVVDFGQNLVGFVQIKLRGNAGDTVKLYHAEVLDKKGNFYTENLREAKQQNIFVLAGKGEEVFEPNFTYQGFRYVRVNNYKGELKPSDIAARAVYADMRPTGNFECSDSLVNKLQHNIQWGQKGNFLEAPTDCPQRDERLGWTGDAQVFFRTGAFNMNIYNFFEKWMKDVAVDQAPDGSLPHTIPNVFYQYPNEDGKGSAGWADVTTIVPWDMYLSYGNSRILAEQYPSMKAWVEYMRSQSENDLWVKGWHFGDWLSFIPENDWEDRGARTNKKLIAQCFYSFSTQLLANAAKVLNKMDDYKTYSDLVTRIKAAYLKEYVTPNMNIMSNTQTAYVLALHFDMLPENLRHLAAKRLADNIASYNDHLTTGFLGTPYLCHVLSRFGYTDVAYKLLMQKDYPSWLYPVKSGATTIWERWDGQKPDGSFQDKGMNSFNHYAYGAIGDWMYRTVAGINPDNSAPGYKKIIIKPQPGGGLKYASASYQSDYGVVSSSWRISGNKMVLNVSVPCNSSATIYIPSGNSKKITESGKSLMQQKSIKVLSESARDVELAVGSGEYHFEVEI